MSNNIEILRDDFWVKVIEMLQQNWALIEPMPSGDVCVYFVDDSSGVFDQLTFSSEKDAAFALKLNGFSRFADDKKLQSFLTPPSGPYYQRPHPNGPIYSSGQYWKS
jgi:hypothetical protein